MEIKTDIKRICRILPILLGLSFIFTDAQAQNYFPVEPGKKWVYQYNGSYNPSGEAKTIVRISEEEVRRGERMYFEMNSVFTSTGSSEPTISKTFIRQSEDGAVYGINPSISEDDYLFFPASPTEGMTWTGLSGTSKITSIKASIETPGGIFSNCIVVESSAGEVKAYSYYQEGKGLVAMKMGDQLIMYLKE